MSLPSNSVTSLHSSRRFLLRLAAFVVLLDAIVITLALLALHQSRVRYEERALTATTNIALFQERDLASTVEQVDLVMLDGRRRGRRGAGRIRARRRRARRLHAAPERAPAGAARPAHHQRTRRRDPRLRAGQGGARQSGRPRLLRRARAQPGRRHRHLQAAGQPGQRRVGDRPGASPEPPRRHLRRRRLRDDPAAVLRRQVRGHRPRRARRRRAARRAARRHRALAADPLDGAGRGQPQRRPGAARRGRGRRDVGDVQRPGGLGRRGAHDVVPTRRRPAADHRRGAGQGRLPGRLARRGRARAGPGHAVRVRGHPFLDPALSLVASARGRRRRARRAGAQVPYAAGIVAGWTRHRRCPGRDRAGQPQRGTDVRLRRRRAAGPADAAAAGRALLGLLAHGGRARGGRRRGRRQSRPVGGHEARPRISGGHQRESRATPTRAGSSPRPSAT